MSSKSKIHSKLKALKITFYTLLLLWVLGFFYFLYKIEHYELENKTATQVVVVFGDSKQAVYVAAELLRLGYAPLVFVAGLEDPSYYINFLKEQGVADYQLIFDKELVNHHKNYAIDTYLLTRKYGFNSVRLVAPAALLPRAMFETKKYLPYNIVVVPHPVSLKSRNYSNIFAEYNKYLLIMIASIFGLENELNISYS